MTPRSLTSYLALLAALVVHGGSAASDASARRDIEPHVSRLFGVAVERGPNGIRTTALSQRREPGALDPAEETSLPLGCVVASHQGDRLTFVVTVAITRNAGTDAAATRPCSTNDVASLDVEAFKDAVDEVAPPMERLMTVVSGHRSGTFPGLRIELRLRNDLNPYRYKITSTDSADVALVLVDRLATTSENTKVDVKRQIIDAIVAGLHEYIHALVALKQVKRFANLATEEAAASMIEYALGFLAAGCTASGTITLPGDAPVTVPVVLAQHRQMLRNAREYPAIEGYALALLNIANGMGTGSFRARDAGVRGRMLAIAMSAYTARKNLRSTLLGPFEIDPSIVPEPLLECVAH